MFDLRLIAEVIDERNEARIGDQHPIARMTCDVADVVRMQPEVQRVEHEASARDAEVRLEMLVVVPAERRDAIARL